VEKEKRWGGSGDAGTAARKRDITSTEISSGGRERSGEGTCRDARYCGVAIREKQRELDLYRETVGG